MMTPERYELLAAPFRRHPEAVGALKGVNRGLTLLCYAVYPLLLAYLFLAEDGRFWRCLLVPGISFAAVSIFRTVYNAPRPYEKGVQSLLKKKKQGCSFPSRHVFSAFIIAVTWYTIHPQMGISLFFVGIILAVIRVIGGVHYPKDVLAGAAVALICGWIGFWLIPV